MSDVHRWLVLALPLMVALIACAGLARAWKTVNARIEKLLAVGSTTVVALYACAALAYVELGGSLPAFDYRIEGLGFLLAALAFTAGIVSLRSPQWFSVISLIASAWLLMLFLLAALTY